MRKRSAGRSLGLGAAVLLALAVLLWLVQSDPAAEFWSHLRRSLEGGESGEYFASLPRPLFLVLLGAATHISEDLTCVAAGLLAAQGILSFAEAVTACFLGIYIGDVLLFLAGRWLGEPAVRRAPLKWFLTPAAVAKAGKLFARRGAMLILLSRFLPGTRAPTYVAAGIAGAPLGKFLLYFALACALWTPLLVGAAKLFGRLLQAHLALWETLALPFFILAGLILYLLFHYGLPALTWRGRRLLLSKWRRLRHWEFWPLWLVNAPLFLYVAVQCFLRYRRPTLFTAANPGIAHGGFIGESKSAILRALHGAGEAVATWVLLPAEGGEERMKTLTEFQQSLPQAWPVVLKSDEGQRGLGVKIVRSPAEARHFLAQAAFPVIAQEYVPGREYGVFYYRIPGHEYGEILSITDKRLPFVTGNGKDNLETLILRDERAVCSAARFLAALADRLDEVPAPGTIVPLSDLGTHSRGALFLDGRHLRTEALRRELDRLLQNFTGFYFGRLDLRVPDEKALMEGRGLRILEVNGVTSECTHIYDPQHSLWYAWRTLFAQWDICLRIARENVARGVEPTPLFAFLREWWQAERRQQHRDIV